MVDALQYQDVFIAVNSYHTRKVMPRSPKVKNELYFTLNLTENEHYIVEDMIREFCKQNGLTVLYYRKLKEGHVPMRRECKVKGDISKLLQFFKDEMIVIGNHPRDTKQADAEMKAGSLTFDQWYEKYRTA